MLQKNSVLQQPQNSHHMIPAFFYSAVTGIVVGGAIVGYRFLASHMISLSAGGYAYLKKHLPLYLPLLTVLLLFSYISAKLYRKHPNVRGGGIPTSIGILRGMIPFRWALNAFRILYASLFTYLVGVPLGNEGPSVQIGTALGRGIVRIWSVICELSKKLAKKLSMPEHTSHGIPSGTDTDEPKMSLRKMSRRKRFWDRYVMTAGACAGFTAATDAPISGMMFAVEEAHQRISPFILITAAVSVTFAKITTAVLSPLVGMSADLFKPMILPALHVSQMWLPLFIGLFVGLSSVVFLKYYEILNHFWTKILSDVPDFLKIFIVLVLTLLFGFFSFDFISTGHSLIVRLMTDNPGWTFLLLCLLLRATLTILASSSGITGGLFLPIMALGAILSSILGSIVVTYTSLTRDYYSVVVVLGIAACMAGMMKTPLTALVFSLEALSAESNILPVLLTVALSYAITELFNVDSVNEHVLKSRLREFRNGKKPTVIDGFVTVHENAFAVGKQVRDIFWPCNLFVLSVKHPAQSGAEVDERGDKTIRAGDVLHIRYSAYDDTDTREELFAIVGEQEMLEHEVHAV